LLVRLAVAAAVAAAAAVVAVVAVVAAAAAAEGAGRRADRTCLLRLLSCKASLHQLAAPQFGRCAAWPVAAAVSAVELAGAGGGEGTVEGQLQSGQHCPGVRGRPGRVGRASR